MNRPARSSRTHRRASASRCLAVALTAATLAAIPAPDVQAGDATWLARTATPVRLTAGVAAFAPTLHDATAVRDHLVAVALPAPQPAMSSLSPEQQQVVDDFVGGGIAGVLERQATSRLTSPEQVQIIHDFFEGGVWQTEGHRFLQLFTDPVQNRFIFDVLTGGVVQVARTWLLTSATTDAQRQAIVDLFPDEVTDYRGGPITVLQRRLIAAAKGNAAVIGLINAIIDNPVTLAVRRLIGGGPIIGTPLSDLPPIPDAPRPPVAAAAITPAVVETTDIETTDIASRSEPTPTRVGPGTARRDAVVPTPDEPTDEEATADEPAVDVMKTGNKVTPNAVATEPTSPTGASTTTPAETGNTTPTGAPVADDPTSGPDASDDAGED